MAASRNDVIEAYRTLLGRVPENERVIDHHLQAAGSIWTIVANILKSEEFRTNRDGRKHLGLDKCFEPQYLVRDLPIATRLACFHHHHNLLNQMLQPSYLEALYFNKLQLWHHVTERHTIEATLAAARTDLAEGEMTLKLICDGAEIYTAGFTFVPGPYLGIAAPTVLLLSRMQRAIGREEAARHATKLMDDVNPQALCFAMVAGIASAVSARAIAIVPARRHVCYGPIHAATFLTHYDSFAITLGATTQANGLHVVDLPLVSKPIEAVAASHRRRARHKRRLRARVASDAADRWVSWCQDPVTLSAVDAHTAGETTDGECDPPDVEVIAVAESPGARPVDGCAVSP